MTTSSHDGHKDTCPKGEPINDDPLDRRTLCRECAATGPGPLDTTSDTASFKSHLTAVVELYASKLGLGQWTLRLSEGFDEHLGEDAYVRVEHRELVATIFVDPRATESQFTRLVAHELIHLVLYDLQRLAMNDQTIEVMDLVDLELERVINRLSTAISGLEWEPVNEKIRKLHEFDDID